MEKWRYFPGTNKYQISIATKEGKCRTLDWKHTGKVRELSNKPNKIHGRIIWSLYIDGKEIHQQAAWFIAKTFPELVNNEWFPGAQIDHIDTDRLNNHPSNLRWVTPKGNANNPLTKLNKQQIMLNRSDESLPVNQYSLNGDFIARYPSIMEAERVTGAKNQAISNCCKGKPYFKTAGGFIWKYA